MFPERKDFPERNSLNCFSVAKFSHPRNFSSKSLWKLVWGRENLIPRKFSVRKLLSEKPSFEETQKPF